MSDRQFSHHATTVLGGPGRVTVTVDITYYDTNGDVLGVYGEDLIGFATTWKDVAEAVRKGLGLLGLDHDPVHHVSPMVDLT
jgi:hypothetical protein